MLSPSVVRFRSSRASLGLGVASLVCYGVAVALTMLHLQASPFPWTAGRWAELGVALTVGAFLSVVLARRFHAGQGVMRGAGKWGKGDLQSQFLTLAEGSPDAIFVLEAGGAASGRSLDFQFRFLNRKGLALLGVDAGKAAGAMVQELMPFLAVEGFPEQFREVLKTGKPLTAEVAVRDGQVRASWVRLSAQRFEGGVLMTVGDLSEQKKLEAQLCQAAQHDKLTGLPNRTLLDDRINQALERAKRNRGAAAVMMLEVDGLEAIQHEHGSVAGDQVLKVVAARMRRSVRATDSVFRLGGDEFVILFADVASEGPVKDFARKIVLSLLPPIAWKGKDLRVSASVGLAMYPVAGTTPETLLVEADIDLRRAKRCRRAQVEMGSRVEELDLRRFSLMLP